MGLFETAMRARKFSFSVRLTAFTLVALVTAFLMEAGARLVLAFEEEIRRSHLLFYPFRRTLVLDPYEMPSPDIGYHWVLRPDRAAAAALIESYRPSFMGRIERIVDEFTAAGSRVVLVTLPGLFVSSEEPSRRALRIGHVPEFTTNPFVLAAMSERKIFSAMGKLFAGAARGYTGRRAFSAALSVPSSR